MTIIIMWPIVAGLMSNFPNKCSKWFPNIWPHWPGGLVPTANLWHIDMVLAMYNHTLHHTMCGNGLLLTIISKKYGMFIMSCRKECIIYGVRFGCLNQPLERTIPLDSYGSIHSSKTLILQHLSEKQIK